MSIASFYIDEGIDPSDPGSTDRMLDSLFGPMESHDELPHTPSENRKKRKATANDKTVKLLRFGQNDFFL